MADIDLTEAVRLAADAIGKCVVGESSDLEAEGKEREARELEAREAIAAALPHIREQLAQQIEADAPSAELVHELRGHLGERRSGMLRAAFIVRGES